MAIYGTEFNITYTAWNTNINSGVAGDSANHTLYWVKDGSASAVTNSPEEVSSANAPGLYKLTITAPEAQCLFGTLCGKSSTSHVTIIPASVPFEKLPNALPGQYGGLPTTDSNNYVMGISGTLHLLDDLNNFNPASDTVVNVTNVTTLGDSGNLAQTNWEYGTRILTADTNINYPSAADNATAIWGAVSRTLTGADNLNIPTSGQNAQMVWEYSTRILTDDTNINYPTSGEIAGAIWESFIVDHNTVGTFGAKNQKVVPSETLNDYKATGFSTHSASDVWSVVSRTLTSDDNINYPDSGTIAQATWEYNTRILTADDNIDIPTTGLIAQAVWEYDTRELTSSGAGGATAQEVWEYSTRILTADTNINYPSSGDIASAVWNNGVRILTANTNLNDPTAAAISSQVAADLLSAHGAGNWTTADTSSLATSTQVLSTSGTVNNINNIVGYNSGILNTINQEVSYILIYNNQSGVPLTSAERNSIADAILQRSMSYVEDTATEYTLCTLILAGLNSSVAGSVRTIRKTDASTLVTQTVTTDATAEPITGVS